MFLVATYLVLFLVGISSQASLKDVQPYDENAAYLAETKSGLFEGDIQTGENFRNIMEDDSMRWPSGVVPYVIATDYDFSFRQLITNSMAEMTRIAAVNGATCIQFVPRSSQNNYIYIYPGGGCSSSVGVQTGRQLVSLGWNCKSKGTVMHELLHALGFWHEQSRPDRNNYVDIFWNNIQTYPNDMKFNFNKEESSRTLGTPYDYDSVMHYGPYSFSTNRQPTILPKDRTKSIGNRSGMSSNDIKKLRLLYECGGTTNVVVPTQPPTNDCRNYHDDGDCNYWAEHGECTKNPTWMSRHCTKSCNKCPSSSCQNKHSSNYECNAWAANGECKKNPNFMLVNCARSCLQC